MNIKVLSIRIDSARNIRFHLLKTGADKSLASSIGSAISTSLASWAFDDFLAISTAFHKVKRSLNSFSALEG